MALIATVGAVDANSYVTVAEATTYFAVGVHPLSATWAALGDDEKTAALCFATKQIDRLRFWGYKATDLQALEFPRYGNCWDPLVLPKELKEACLEQAISAAPNLASGGQGRRERLQAAGVQSFSIGEMSETFAASRTNPTFSGTAESQLCQTTRILLSGFVKRTGSVRPGRRLS